MREKKHQPSGEGNPHASASRRDEECTWHRPDLESQLALRLPQGTPEGTGLPSRNRKLLALRDIFCFKSIRGFYQSQKK